jgi:hypothetical protein
LIESGTHGTKCTPATVAAERLPNCVYVGAVLQGERKHDGGASRVCVRLIPSFVVVQKEFTDLSIIEAAHCRRELESSQFENKRLASTSVWQPPSDGL